MRTISTLNAWSQDISTLLSAYEEFMQDDACQQKSYLNFLNFLKTQKWGYGNFSAGKIGDIFAIKWAHEEFMQDASYKQKNYLNFLNFLKTKKDGYGALSAGEIGDIFEDLGKNHSALKAEPAQEEINLPWISALPPSSKSEIHNILDGQEISKPISKPWILGRIRNAINTRVAATLAFFSVLSFAPINTNQSKAENPDIYGIDVTPGNAKRIQYAAQSDLKHANTIETKQKLENNVHTTPQERTFLQNYAIDYAFNHKTWYVDKRDGGPQVLMDATKVYNDLGSTLKNIPWYNGANLSPEKKVVYDIIFCLEQLGYHRDSHGRLRDFDWTCCVYTNDLVIAIMEFQKDQWIRIDAIAGPETFRHLNKQMEQGTDNTLQVINIIIDDQGKTTAYDTNVSVNNVINTDQNTDGVDAITSTPSAFQLTLEKYLIGREVGFIDEAMAYINEKRNNYEQLIADITAIENSAYPTLDKKALMLSKLKEYGIENKLVILERKIGEYELQGKCWPELDELKKQRSELLKKATLNQPTQSVFDYSPDGENIDSKLAKKALQKPKMMKLKNAVNDIITEKITIDTNANYEIGNIFSTIFYDELQNMDDPDLISKFTETYDMIFVHGKKNKIPELTDNESKSFRQIIRIAYDKSIVGQSQETIAILFMDVDQRLYGLKKFNYIENFHSGIDANYYEITWSNLIKRWILPEDLVMTFDEFSSLEPATILALLNYNIDLNKDDRKKYNCNF